ncbi:hypothetical protein N9K16_03535 [Alphaproteobacteria bacterium]|nr:hypothetical protein [Alphaproteobacteria bacterium]
MLRKSTVLMMIIVGAGTFLASMWLVPFLEVSKTWGVPLCAGLLGGITNFIQSKLNW